MIIDKTSLCWNCPAFKCTATIMDIDDDMDITEIEKNGTCEHGSNIFICEGLFKQIKEALIPLTEALVSIIDPLIEILKDTLPDYIIIDQPVHPAETKSKHLHHSIKPSKTNNKRLPYPTWKTQHRSRKE